MTVSTTTARDSYTATASQTVFAYTFNITDEDHIAVYVDDVLQTISTDYTVSGVDSGSGGNVTFVDPMDGGESVVFLRNVPLTQLVDYTPFDDFPSETHEEALDLLTMMIQQINEKLGRQALLPPSTGLSGITLPAPGAGKVIRWNAAGTDLEAVAVAVLDSSLDVALASQAENDILVWDGTQWVNHKQVTSGERTTGTETDIRAFAPADVKSMIDTHASASANVLSAKSSDYTIDSADVSDGLLTVVPIDISAGDVDITELALASMGGVVRYAVVDWDGAGATYKARVMDSGASEVATLYAVGDCIDIAYDGTNRRILAEQVTARGVWTLDSDKNVSTSESDLLNGATGTVHENIGAMLDAATNYRLDIPFNCLIRLWGSVNKDDNQNGYFHVEDDGGATVVNCNETMDTAFNWIYDTTGTAYLTLRVAGNGGTVTFRGDGSVGETYFGWEVIRRYR